MLRRLSILAAACAFAGVPAAPSLAANPPYRPGGTHTVTTSHFQVWYDTDSAQPDYTTQTEASDLAGLAEKAYAIETGWGLPAPVDDGDGHIDIFVVDPSAFPGIPGYTLADSASAPTSGSIDIARTEVGTDTTLHTIAAQIYYLIMLRRWLPASQSERWLSDGAAAWAGYRVDSYRNSSGSTAPTDLSLDCHDVSVDLNMCSKDASDNSGASRWTFYELLAQKFGPTFVDSVNQQAEAQGSPLAGLQAALDAKHSTLADTFNDFAVREMAHGWGISALDSDPIPVSAGPISTGASTGAIPTTTVSVDHLAARILSFSRGDGHGEHACFKATLKLNVAIPSGTGSRPFWRWSADATPTPLSISGSNATIDVPWDTCTWASGAGYLVLPNDSTSVDAANFTVTGSLTVDTTTPATPGVAPTPTTLTGTVVPVPTSAVPPTIDLLAPLLLHVSASAPKLRLIVASTGDGSVHVTLGSVDLGTPTVRMGNNDLRFALPKSLLSAIRRSTAAGNVLTVTPVASSGTVLGQPITRRVAVTPAPPTKHKKK